MSTKRSGNRPGFFTGGQGPPHPGHAILELEPELEETAEAVAVDTEALRHRIVQEESRAIKPMSVDEAMMQLDLVEDPFVVFLNVVTDQVNVLYKRGDGMYGLIGPQQPGK